MTNAVLTINTQSFKVERAAKRNPESAGAVLAICLFAAAFVLGNLCARLAGPEFAVSIPLNAFASGAGALLLVLSALILRAGIKGLLTNVVCLGSAAAIILGLVSYIALV